MCLNIDIFNTKNNFAFVIHKLVLYRLYTNTFQSIQIFIILLKISKTLYMKIFKT